MAKTPGRSGAANELDRAARAIRWAVELLHEEGDSESVQMLFVAHQGIERVKAKVLARKP